MNEEFRLMPEQASSIAGEVDDLYTFLVLVSGFFSVLIAVLIVVFAIKYRRGSPADRTQGPSHFFAMELSWIVIPFVISMVMFFWGARLYFEQSRPPAGAMEIDCVGRQWMWKFQHPEGNAEINDLHVPLNQPVKIRLISEDVIHSLFVPAFRIKHDVLPGRYTSVWFTPTKPGKYHLFCAEYCGAKHSEMRGYVHVLEPAEYQAWLSSGNPGVSTAEAGRMLFEQLRCNSCHQGGGMASRGPPLENLLGRTVQLQGGGSVVADENYIRESILRPNAKVVAGYQPIMPSFEGQIDEAGLLQLIAEIKSLSRGDRQTPSNGKSEAPPAEEDGAEGAAAQPMPGTDRQERTSPQ
jgi:cytochrome c oxidase subunit 2